jgi:hypothetical protein
MSPLRWDVLFAAFVLAIPLLALGMRGDLSSQEVVTRLPWCLAAGWAAVAVLRWASQPRGASAARADEPAPHDNEPSPAA